VPFLRIVFHFGFFAPAAKLLRGGEARTAENAQRPPEAFAANNGFRAVEIFEGVLPLLRERRFGHVPQLIVQNNPCGSSRPARRGRIGADSSLNMDGMGGFCQQLLNQNKGGTLTYPTAAFMAFGYNSCEADTGLIERFDLRCIGHFEIPIPPVGRRERRCGPCGG
jgi:hypothetical protein